MIQRIRKFTASVVAVALVGINLSLPANGLANKKDDTPIIGQLAVNGDVTVNGKKAITGSTIFNDSRVSVACATGYSASVNLGRLGRIQLSPGTQMVLRFADNLISGELLSGKAVVNNEMGVKVSVTTPEGVSTADGKVASSLAISTQKGTRCVPMSAKSSGNSGSGGSSSGGGGAALGAGGLAAIAAGAGGVAIAAGVAASGKNNSSVNASFTLP